jgi:hypothetical protein
LKKRQTTSVSSGGYRLKERIIVEAHLLQEELPKIGLPASASTSAPHSSNSFSWPQKNPNSASSFLFLPKLIYPGDVLMTTYTL